MPSADAAVDVLVRLGATVGECPVYDADSATLYSVDIPAGRLWRCPLDGPAEHLDVGGPLGCVALVEGGGFLLGTRTGVATMASWGDPTQAWVPLEPDLPTQCNDGRCDPQGRFVVGTATTDQSALGALYLVDHEGRARPLVTGVGMSNGLDWSPDGRTLYYADSIAGTVTRYPWEAAAGTLGAGTVVVELDPDDGLPDGLTVDDEGTFWLAVWGAGEVRRFDPDGRPVETVRLPTPHVTSCAFGGRERNLLFVTSASSGVPPDDPGRAEAGTVFVVPTGSTGAAPTRFRRLPDPGAP